MIAIKIFKLFFILHYLARPTNSACSGLNHGSRTNNFQGRDYQSSARPGIWFIVTYFYSGGYLYFDNNRCPSGTSLMYIKTNDDWIDYKYLRGGVII